MVRFVRCLALSFVFLATAWSARLPAQDKKDEKKIEKKVEKKVFLDAQEAGPEFAVQGEYEGTIGSEKFGAQVVALGKNQFDVVLEKGGLPGAGWDGKTKIKATAALDPEGTSATIQSKGVVGKIQLGQRQPATLTGKMDDAGEIKLVRVERKSPTVGAKAPEGALILFDGTNADEWKEKRIQDGLLPVAASTKKSFKDFTLHIEFRTPFQPTARGQGRGNSGVYLHGRDEVQVLDSFGLKGENNECGGLYGRKAPSVNMCLPPLSWQTYDITVRTDPNDAKKAKLSVQHNGVLVHEDVAIGGGAGPINLQNHGNPVFYRNIWLVELK